MNPTDSIFQRALTKMLTEIFDGPPGDENPFEDREMKFRPLRAYELPFHPRSQHTEPDPRAKKGDQREDVLPPA